MSFLYFRDVTRRMNTFVRWPWCIVPGPAANDNRWPFGTGPDSLRRS